MYDDFDEYIDIDEFDEYEDFSLMLDEIIAEEMKHICHRIKDCAYGYYTTNLFSFCQYCLLKGELRGEPAGTCTKFTEKSEEINDDKKRTILY